VSQRKHESGVYENVSKETYQRDSVRSASENGKHSNILQHHCSVNAVLTFLL